MNASYSGNGKTAIKPTFSVTLTVLLTAAALLVSMYAFTAAAYAYDTITENGIDYYLLGSVDDLYWFAQEVNNGNPSINARLIDDISVNKNLLNVFGELSKAHDVTKLQAWTPIEGFSGIFDGAGYTISGLYYSDDWNSNIGLFKSINDGTIKNVSVVDSYFYGESYIGGICGNILNGTIKNCSSFATIVGTGMYFGGICGSMESGAVIENCYYYGIINAGNDVGGICGYNEYGSVENCYYLDTIISKYNTDGTAMTAKQFASGEVTWLLNNGDNQASQAVWYQNRDWPGFMGCPVTNDNGIYTYNINHTSLNEAGLCTNCGGYQPATFVNGVYEINNAGQLYWFAKFCDNIINQARLTSDITVNAIVLNADGTLDYTVLPDKWTPIKEFSGTFDGAGHTISGLYKNDEAESDIGLFGIINGGTVKNVSVVNSYFNGASNIGSICGINKNGTIENCSSFATIEGVSMYSGGICGSMTSGAAVRGCNFSGNLTVKGSNFGGICGEIQIDETVSDAAIIENCYFSGTLTVSGSYFGGICGSMTSGAVIKNCYYNGSIIGSGDVGGICGNNEDGSVENCYYLDTTTSVNNYGTAKPQEAFASGEVTWLLNGGKSNTAADKKIWAQGANNPVFADDNTPTFKCATLNLESDLSVSFYVDNTGGTAPTLEIYSMNGDLLATLENNADGTLIDNTWKYTFKGIAAKNAGDEFIVICGGSVTLYGVKDYCLNQLDKSESKLLKTLCADLLNYASAAQTYFGYNTDYLANNDTSGIIEENATQVTPDMSSVHSLSTTMADADEKATFYAVSLLLKEKVSIRYKLTPAEGSDLTAENTRLAVNVDGEIQYITGDVNGDGKLCFTLDTLNASEMRKTVTSYLVYDNGNENYTPVSETLTYSIETYAARMNANSSDKNLKALVVAMIKYGDAAAEFFAQP